MKYVEFVLWMAFILSIELKDAPLSCEIKALLIQDHWM